MSRYVSILANGRPFPFNVDANNRHMFSCNFELEAAALVAQMEEEIAKIINDASLGTLNTDMFIGTGKVLPTGSGPYVTLMDTGGISPLETQNGDIYEMMSLQVIVTAETFTTGRTRALAIWSELDGTRDKTVTL